jgi:hypothetical protein
MTWKSYAVVSSATVLAGWLASASPSNAPTPAVTRAPQTPRAGASAASDIADQAARLQARLRGERAYAEPQRNPFRFDARRSASDTFESRAERIPAPDISSDDAAPIPPPPLTLSGIAEDQANGQISRTAVVSTPGGVQLVREGDELFGYRAVRVESDAIELSAPDGRILRLTLSNPKAQ